MYIAISALKIYLYWLMFKMHLKNINSNCKRSSSLVGTPHTEKRYVENNIQSDCKMYK